MQNILHKNQSRGYADHGWLKSYHTFSFAGYHNPERTHFGAIRVLNDDVVLGGMGFDTHPHANMEIVSIPLSGALEHKDSTGRHKMIKTGEVQIMSAGTGIQHSENNASKTEPVNFLQIWVLPEERNIAPRYDQIEYDLESAKNKLVNVVAPDNPEALWINQKAWFWMTDMDRGKIQNYQLKSLKHGVYAFMIEGSVKVGDQMLEKRDGYGLTQMENLQIEAVSDCRLLLIETTMAV